MPRETVGPWARAKAYADTWADTRLRMPIKTAFLAGHRANRLTKAEREVVEAAKAFVRREPNSAPKLDAAVSNLERAKGRKP